MVCEPYSIYIMINLTEKDLTGKSAGCPTGRKADPVIISMLPGSPVLCLPVAGRGGELHSEKHSFNIAHSPTLRRTKTLANPLVNE